MKRSLLVIILFSFTLFFLSTCHKKYEEDDRKYLKTPCGRIAKKWQLYKITDYKGRDYKDSIIYYQIPGNGWAIKADQSFTYNGLILELKRSSNKLCLETGIGGKAVVSNKPFSSGYYEIKFKRTMIKLDIKPDENTPTRYFIDDYTIYKMTSDEFIFGHGLDRAYFKVAD